MGWKKKKTLLRELVRTAVRVPTFRYGRVLPLLSALPYVLSLGFLHSLSCGAALGFRISASSGQRWRLLPEGSSREGGGEIGRAARHRTRLARASVLSVIPARCGQSETRCQQQRCVAPAQFPDSFALDRVYHRIESSTSCQFEREFSQLALTHSITFGR